MLSVALPVPRAPALPRALGCGRGRGEGGSGLPQRFFLSGKNDAVCHRQSGGEGREVPEPGCRVRGGVREAGGQPGAAGSGGRCARRRTV